MTDTKTPPLGIKPRRFFEEDQQYALRCRGLELADAIKRYISVDRHIPREWIDELKDKFSAE